MKKKIACIMILILCVLFVNSGTFAESKNVGNGTVVEYDLSNANDGIFRFKVTGDSDVKVLIRCNDVGYVYHLIPSDDWNTIPAVFGNGIYKLYMVRYGVTKVKSRNCITCTVDMEDPSSVFLISNQNINYEDSELIDDYIDNIDLSGDFEQDICNIYQEVSSIYYDYIKLYLNNEWYLPDIDEIIIDRSGVCLDSSSLFAAICRLSGIKCQVVIGEYCGDRDNLFILREHAWVRVWDGEEWVAFDPSNNSVKGDIDYSQIIMDDSMYNIHCVY